MRKVGDVGAVGGEARESQDWRLRTWCDVAMVCDYRASLLESVVLCGDWS